MWKFLVKNQSIEILEREVLADHQIQYVQFRFTFDGDWKKFHKVVQFSQCDEVYSIVLGFDGTSCYLPAELHVGAVKMSVFGYDAESDTTVRATIVPVTLNIRESGFVGDDDSPFRQRPICIRSCCRKSAKFKQEFGLSAFEIAKENGFVGTVAEWLESLKGADGLPGRDGIDGKNGTDGKDGKDGKDGVDGITPDMSQYPTTSAVELIIQKITDPLSLKSHEHENQSILDATTASYTLEEQRKLAEISPSDYATKKALADEALAIREAMIPLTRELHSHENMAVLDMLTAEQMALLEGLQQFEDSTKYDIQTIRESVEPVISQAHWHHNLTLLNSITAAKIAKWDSFENFGTQINGLSTRITIYSDKIESLQKQINTLKNNGYTVLFEYGEDAIEKFADTIGFMLNGGFHTMSNFCNQYEHVCCADNNFALYYGQEDFNWDAQILTVVEKKLDLTSDSKVQICYNSGATEDGELYLIAPPGGKIDIPITAYVKGEIDRGRAVLLDFQWLQSQKFITTEISCGGINPGEYYLAWVGRSNNTRPMIRSVKVREVAV